mmetsp:Transcript_128265/g.411002  ORF Transcript_128265/g.411002 Transcript_128265/m.411002 type:complete len:344 (-) Transcript_128265:240-1271(-)
MLGQICVIHRVGAPGGLLAQQLVAEQRAGGRDVRRQVLDHFDLHERKLEQVPHEVAVRLGAAVHALIPLQELHGRRAADLPPQHGQHRHLHAHDLLFGVGLVGDVDEVVDAGGAQLLELGRDEQSSDAHELQELPRGGLPRQVGVDEADREEERLRLELVLLVDIDEPVDKDGPHLRIHVLLALHVVRRGQLGGLLAAQHREDVRQILNDLLGVLGPALVHIAHRLLLPLLYADLCPCNKRRLHRGAARAALVALARARGGARRGQQATGSGARRVAILRHVLASGVRHVAQHRCRGGGRAGQPGRRVLCPFELLLRARPRQQSTRVFSPAEESFRGASEAWI